MVGSWLHLLALTAYLGSLVGLWLMVLPALPAIGEPEKRADFLARSLRLYNPLQTGALGLLVLSGAFQITELKAAYRQLFIKELGLVLGLKLTFAFFLIIVSVYQAMGVGHRFVRRREGGETLSAAEIDSVIRRLRVSTFLILVLAAITLWLGVGLRER